MTDCDVAIIGAGIAGASLAAELAGDRRVILFEAEDHPGYHTTGRSAAFWEECYGGPGIMPLTLASHGALKDGGFLRQRGALYLVRHGEGAKAAAFVASYADRGAQFQRLDRAAIARLVPGLQPEWGSGLFLPRCADIDVAALHQHYLAEARGLGAELRLRHRLEGADAAAGEHTLSFTNGESVTAHAVVIAAGAWADPVAETLGARPLGITPMRRTVVQLRTAPPPPRAMPLVLDLDGQFYFKPEGDRLWLSPHDETPSPPCDAAPDEVDIATAIERLGHVTDWRVESVERKWAGLRSFAPDRLPVYGYDPRADGVFWFAGQGGYGIQTAPAAARLAAALFRRECGALPGGIDPAPYDPARFA